MSSTPDQFCEILNRTIDVINTGQVLAKASDTAYDTEWTNPPIGICDYSTTEQDTGCKWIDGKHIYKKTIDFGTLPNNTRKYANANIQNLDKIIKIEGIANGAGNAAPLPLVYLSNDSAYNAEVSFDYNSGRVQIGTNRDRSSYYAYVTLYYTKTS